MISALHVDFYQLSSLVPHWDAGIARTPVCMSFFSRKLPTNEAGAPVRPYLVQAALHRILGWLGQARLDDAHLETLRADAMLGPALKSRPDLEKALRDWRFRGRIRAPLDGVPLWFGPAVGASGPLEVDGVRPSAGCPYLQVDCDILTAKLIETPLLSLLNHMTMVASKAARVVVAAKERAVLEFGQRRTHPHAAVDAALAAYIAGCVGTSNVEAGHRYRIPVMGTMDHFAVQAWERPGVPRAETETAFFAAFHDLFPRNSLLLVDTYDTWQGIRSAVTATRGQLAGIRMDSGLSVESIRRARRLLDSLGAGQARIAVSGGLDEHEVLALREAPVDVFGVGERISTSADAPVGVGAVAKLCVVGDQPTMKLSRGSGKATLPGRLQVFRQEGVDTVALEAERLPGTPLLAPVWDGEAPLPISGIEESRARALESYRELPETPRRVEVRVSPGLEALVRGQVAAAG